MTEILELTALISFVVTVTGLLIAGVIELSFELSRLNGPRAALTAE